SLCDRSVPDLAVVVLAPAVRESPCGSTARVGVTKRERFEDDRQDVRDRRRGHEPVLVVCCRRDRHRTAALHPGDGARFVDRCKLGVAAQPVQSTGGNRVAALVGRKEWLPRTDGDVEGTWHERDRLCPTGDTCARTL